MRLPFSIRKKQIAADFLFWIAAFFERTSTRIHIHLRVKAILINADARKEEQDYWEDRARSRVKA